MSLSSCSPWLELHSPTQFCNLSQVCPGGMESVGKPASNFLRAHKMHPVLYGSWCAISRGDALFYGVCRTIKVQGPSEWDKAPRKYMACVLMTWVVFEGSPSCSLRSQSGAWSCGFLRPFQQPLPTKAGGELLSSISL